MTVFRRRILHLVLLFVKIIDMLFPKWKYLLVFIRRYCPPHTEIIQKNYKQTAQCIKIANQSMNIQKRVKMKLFCFFYCLYIDHEGKLPESVQFALGSFPKSNLGFQIQQKQEINSTATLHKMSIQQSSSALTGRTRCLQQILNMNCFPCYLAMHQRIYLTCDSF